MTRIIRGIVQVIFFVWISKKLGLQRKQTPEVLKSGKIRVVVFALFLVGLGYTIYTITQGRKFPLPLIIIPLGVITAFFLLMKGYGTVIFVPGAYYSVLLQDFQKEV